MFQTLRRPMTLAIAALCLAIASPVLAQDSGTIPVPRAEISGGYMFMRDFSDDNPNGDAVNFPAGWYLSGAVNPTEWLGLVGEFSGSIKNDFNIAFEGLNFSNTMHVYTFLAGPRFFAKIGRVAPFAQVLAGVAHMRLDTDLPAGLPISTVKARTTNVAVQPGGGLTVFLTDRVGVRVEGDYRTIVDFVTDAKNDYAKQFRVTTGFVMQWGGQ